MPMATSRLAAGVAAGLFATSTPPGSLLPPPPRTCSCSASCCSPAHSGSPSARALVPYTLENETSISWRQTSTKKRGKALQSVRKITSQGLKVSSKQATVSPPSTTDAAQETRLYDCVVVGAGISGLCTAQALLTRHAGVVGSVLVTEAKDRVGGNITTVSGDGYLWEEGPNSFQPNDSMLSMAVHLSKTCDAMLLLLFWVSTLTLSQKLNRWTVASRMNLFWETPTHLGSCCGEGN